MILANPIYDVVFKYLLEDLEIAKELLSTILAVKVVNIAVKSQEELIQTEEGEETSTPLQIATPTPPETFTVGVTDYTFNPINAIFGRVLHTPEGHIVTLAYWQQKETVSHDEVPYFERQV